MTDDSSVLVIEDLRVEFRDDDRVVSAVQGVSLEVYRGETVGLVGESGSGKSMTALALMGLVPPPGRVVQGSFRWQGHTVEGRDGLRELRGDRITMIFQDPSTSLNPLVKVGRQITEVLRVHVGLSRSDARRRAIELMDLVGIPSARTRFDQFPYEFSGGMRQRLMIAIALAPDPDLLIADEPTTALDVTIQAQILELIGELQKELNQSMILITHDLGVIAGVCDRVAVMYGGRVMEEGSARKIFAAPRHPYTAGLLASTPRVDVAATRLSSIPGSPPTVLEDVPGCPFAPRCARVTEKCVRRRPVLQVVDPEGGRGDAGRESRAACWHVF